MLFRERCATGELLAPVQQNALAQFDGDPKGDRALLGAIALGLDAPGYLAEGNCFRGRRQVALASVIVTGIAPVGRYTPARRTDSRAPNYRNGYRHGKFGFSLSE